MNITIVSSSPPHHCHHLHQMVYLYSIGSSLKIQETSQIQFLRTNIITAFFIIKIDMFFLLIFLLLSALFIDIQMLFLFTSSLSSSCNLKRRYLYQGWTGKLFFSQGGAGLGGARPKIYGAGRGGEPPLPTTLH